MNKFVAMKKSRIRSCLTPREDLGHRSACSESSLGDAIVPEPEVSRNSANRTDRDRCGRAPWIVPRQAWVDTGHAPTVYTRALLFLVSASIGITTSAFAVASQRTTASTVPGASDASTIVVQSDSGPSDSSRDDWFADVEALEDPSLASQSAKGLTNGELVLVIIFLILLFPVGVILLIVFLVT